MKPETGGDPFQCRCGPCRNFWKKNFSGFVPLLEKTPLHRASATAVMYDAVREREDHPAVLKIGDRVIVRDQFQGVVKFVGLLDEATLNPSTYVGVHLDENVGSRHNGVINGKRYFHCPRGHGALVKYGEVVRMNPPEVKPPVSGNDMFPSYREVVTKRKQQKERAERELRAQKEAERQARFLWRHRFSMNSLDAEEEKTQMGGLEDFFWDSFESIELLVTDEDGETNQKTHKRTRRLRRPMSEPEWKPKTRPMDDSGINKHVQRWQKQFGEGDQAERMASTLKKLHLGYRQGFQMKVEKSKEEQKKKRRPSRRPSSCSSASGSEGSSHTSGDEHEPLDHHSDI